MADKIYLGSMGYRKDGGWGRIYLTKHSWDCGWYWGFGYVGNNSCHFHMESLIKHGSDMLAHCKNHCGVKQIFSGGTWLTQAQWWIIRDLFIQAYALKEAAETYVYGGHQTSAAAPYRIKNEERAAQINDDLGKLLDNIWNLLGEWRAKQ